MVPRRLVLGVDGGNTKTIAIVAGFDGEICGWSRTSSSDVHGQLGADGAVVELGCAVDQALAMAGATGEHVGLGVFGLCGADWPEDFTLLEQAMRQHVAGDVVILNDAVSAVRCGTSDGVGVVVSCGTGGTAAAVGRDGSVFHRGFWPEPSGAREIGRLGLRAVQRAQLALDPPTALTERALARYGASDPDDLLYRTTRRGRGTAMGAGRFAPDVLDAAEAGDAQAVAIVRHEGTVLGEQARVAARMVGFGGAYPLVLTGGVLRHPSPVLRAAIQAQLPGATAVSTRWEPAVAALLRAFDRLGVDATARVEDTLPDASLFATDD